MNELEREVRTLGFCGCVRLLRMYVSVYLMRNLWICLCCFFVLCLEGKDAIKGTKQTGVIMPEDPTLNEDSKVLRITT